MFIYHSDPNDVRVTVVGVLQNEELLVSVARCSPKDTFRKRTKVIPARPEFSVMTGEGVKTIPEKPEEILVGGIDIALGRINDGCIYTSYPLKECTSKQFNTIARGVIAEVVHNPELVEKCKI